MNWNKLPQEYKDLEKTFNSELVDFNKDINYLPRRFIWNNTPQHHNFWLKCWRAKTIEELPKILKNFHTISQSIIDRYTFDEFVDGMSKDSEELKDYFIQYKEYLSSELPEFTIEEILLFNKFKSKLDKIYIWTNSELYLKLLEFEQRKQ